RWYPRHRWVGRPGWRGHRWAGGCWNCGGWGWRHHRHWGAPFYLGFGSPYYGYPYGYGYYPPYYGGYWGPSIGFGLRIHYGPVRELSLQGEGFRADSIVPLAVEVVAGEVDGIHFGVGHLDAGRIGVLIELATNLQTGLGRRRGDQLDDDLMADERSAAPV